MTKFVDNCKTSLSLRVTYHLNFRHDSANITGNTAVMSGRQEIQFIYLWKAEI